MHLNTEITAMPDSDKRRQTAAAFLWLARTSAWKQARRNAGVYRLIFLNSTTLNSFIQLRGGLFVLLWWDGVESPKASGCCFDFLLRPDAKSA